MINCVDLILCMFARDHDLRGLQNSHRRRLSRTGPFVLAATDKLIMKLLVILWNKTNYNKAYSVGSAFISRGLRKTTKEDCLLYTLPDSFCIGLADEMIHSMAADIERQHLAVVSHIDCIPSPAASAQNRTPAPRRMTASRCRTPDADFRPSSARSCPINKNPTTPTLLGSAKRSHPHAYSKTPNSLCPTLSLHHIIRVS